MERVRRKMGYLPYNKDYARVNPGTMKIKVDSK